MSSTFHVCSLPDLCLLVVFDHLPLLDLFNRIPLVCPRWTTLQPVALKRRTRLYLSNTYVRYKWPTPCAPLDLLPLPSTYEGWSPATTIACRRGLLRPESVEWLSNRRLPNITQLKIQIRFYSWREKKSDDHRFAHLRRAIYEQAVRLAIGTRWTAQLTTLKLYMSQIFLSNGYRRVRSEFADDVIEAINDTNRMPRLTILHLTDVPDGTSIPLDSNILTRLRKLRVDGASSEWLWRSLYHHCMPEMLTAKQSLRPDLSIEIYNLSPWSLFQVKARAATGGKHNTTTTVLDHIRVLDLSLRPNPTERQEQQVSLILSFVPDRCCSQFRSLRSLSLTAKRRGLGSDDASLVVSVALRRLASLRSLVKLSLSNFTLVLPIVDNQLQQRSDNKPGLKLPYLQELTIVSTWSFTGIIGELPLLKSHSDLGGRQARDWAQWMPSLKRLTIDEWTHRFSCGECHTNTDHERNQRTWDETERQCHRLAIEPLQVCKRLQTVKFMFKKDYHTATRTDMSAPFQWN